MSKAWKKATVKTIHTQKKKGKKNINLLDTTTSNNTLNNNYPSKTPTRICSNARCTVEFRLIAQQKWYTSTVKRTYIYSICRTKRYFSYRKDAQCPCYCCKRRYCIVQGGIQPQLSPPSTLPCWLVWYLLCLHRIVKDKYNCTKTCEYYPTVD